jgi:maltose O-acetyltransferase
MASSEKAKMIRGDHYDASDPELRRDRLRARELTHQLNVAAPRGHLSTYADTVAELMPNATRPIWLQPPFYCDYGYNLHIGKNVFINFNCVFLDCAPITIGDDCQFGPNVQLYTASHPLSAKSRRAGVEFAKPITIGRDCWMGGGVIVCPGIAIGDRCVIGAGAVVTKNVPDNSMAVGNPARVIRSLL